MKNSRPLPSTLAPAATGTPRRPRPAPSWQAVEAAQSIRMACTLGITNPVLIADLIDYSTRCPQLDAVATAAAELLATLPVAAVHRHRNPRGPMATCQRPVFKLACALKSLVDADVDLAPHALTAIKKLTSKSFSA